MKTCTSCLMEFPIAYFSWKRKAKNTKQSICPPCQNQRSKRHYLANRDKYIQRAMIRRPRKTDSIKNKPVEELTNGSKRRVKAKKRFCNENDIRYQCSICTTVEWMGEELVLQFDHIDGNRNNNDKSNLRLVCPNCHSQTPTYCGRNSRRYNNADIA